MLWIYRVTKNDRIQNECERNGKNGIIGKDGHGEKTGGVWKRGVRRTYTEKDVRHTVIGEERERKTGDQVKGCM